MYNAIYYQNNAQLYCKYCIFYCLIVAHAGEANRGCVWHSPPLSSRVQNILYYIYIIW